MSYSAPNVVGYPPGIYTHSDVVALYPRTAAGTGAWPTANLAIYVPMLIRRPVVIRKLGLANGGVVSGNFDIGIYGASGTRLVSTGSTSQSGTTTAQIVDVTDTTLAVGLYYFAANMDNITGTTYRRTIAAPMPLANGVLSEAVGAVTLPATATWAADQTLAYIPGIYAFVEATPA